MPGRIGKFEALAFAVSIVTCFSGMAEAATGKSANLEAERQQLFTLMLQQPDNLDVALSYASLSVRVGDLEGAVSTLERMLIFAPGLARLQLELGVLYYRLGNFDTAEAYFKEAVAGQGTQPEIRLRAEEYLELVEKKLKRFRWSAKTFVGLRWQSNANSAPGSSNIILNGLPVSLNNNSVKKSDFGFVTASNAHLEYDFHNQGDKFELDYVDYGTFQFDQTRLNAAVSEVTAGPAFNLGRFEIDETFASVYLIANGAMLDGKIYFGTLGVGSRLVSRVNRELEFVVKGEFRHQWFNNSRNRRLATDRNGNEFRGIGELKYLFSRDFRGVFGTRISRKDRRAGFYDYWEYGAQARFDWVFDPLSTAQELPWTLTTSAGYLHRDYDRPDPAVSATRSQNDNEYWVGGVLKVPLSSSWAIMPKIGYRQVSSNNPLRDYKAFTATIGVEFSQ